MLIFSRFLYPPDFVKRIKEKFPENTELHALVNQGSIFCVEEALKRVSPKLHEEFKKVWKNRPKDTTMMLGM